MDEEKKCACGAPVEEGKETCTACAVPAEGGDKPAEEAAPVETEAPAEETPAEEAPAEEEKEGGEEAAV